MRNLLILLIITLFSTAFGQFSLRDERISFFEYNESESEEENTQRFFEYVTVLHVDDNSSNSSKKPPNPGDPTPIDQGTILLVFVALGIASFAFYQHYLKKENHTSI